MKKLIASVLFVLCSIFAFSTPAQAKVMYQEKGSLVVAKTETLDDDLFIAAESVTIDGNVLGSVFAGTGKYAQAGSIKGDLVLGTGDAMISGNVGGDIYLGSGNAYLSKVSVGGNIIAGAGNLTKIARSVAPSWQDQAISKIMHPLVAVSWLAQVLLPWIVKSAKR